MFPTSESVYSCQSFQLLNHVIDDWAIDKDFREFRDTSIHLSKILNSQQKVPPTFLDISVTSQQYFGDKARARIS